MENKIRFGNENSITIRETTLQEKASKIVKEMTRALKSVADELDKYRVEILKGSWYRDRNNVWLRDRNRDYLRHYAYGIKITDKDILEEMDEILGKILGIWGTKFTVVTRFIVVIRDDICVQWCIINEDGNWYDCDFSYIHGLIYMLRRYEGEDKDNLIAKFKNVLEKMIDKISNTVIDGPAPELVAKLSYAIGLSKALMKLVKNRGKTRVVLKYGEGSGYRNYLYSEYDDFALIETNDEDLFNAVSKIIQHGEELSRTPEVLYIIITDDGMSAIAFVCMESKFDDSCEVTIHREIDVFEEIGKLVKKRIIVELPSLSSDYTYFIEKRIASL